MLMTMRWAEAVGCYNLPLRPVSVALALAVAPPWLAFRFLFVGWLLGSYPAQGPHLRRTSLDQVCPPVVQVLVPGRSKEPHNKKSRHFAPPILGVTVQKKVPQMHPSSMEKIEVQINYYTQLRQSTSYWPKAWRGLP